MIKYRENTLAVSILPAYLSNMEEAGKVLFEIIKSASDGVVHGGAFVQIFVTILVILLGAGLKALANHFVATDNKVGKAVMLIVSLLVLCIVIIGVASSGDKKSDIPQEEPHTATDSSSPHKADASGLYH